MGSGRLLLNAGRKAFGEDWCLRIEVPVGVFLLSGLVLDGIFRLHDAFLKRLGGWGKGIWRFSIAFWDG